MKKQTQKSNYADLYCKFSEYYNNLKEKPDWYFYGNKDNEVITCIDYNKGMMTDISIIEGKYVNTFRNKKFSPKRLKSLFAGIDESFINFKIVLLNDELND